MKIQIGDEVRDMTAEEAANYSRVVREAEAQLQADAERDAARASGRAKLAALGLTDAEIAALLGA